MPNVTYKIKVELSGSSENTGGGKNDGMLSPLPNGSVGGFSTKSYAGLQVAQYAAKKLLNYAASSIEMYTGNSVLKAQVDSGMRMAGYAAGIMVNPILGIAAMAVDLSISAATRSWEIKWQNREAEEMLRRSGNYLSNGGRQ